MKANSNNQNSHSYFVHTENNVRLPASFWIAKIAKFYCTMLNSWSTKQTHKSDGWSFPSPIHPPSQQMPTTQPQLINKKNT